MLDFMTMTILLRSPSFLPPTIFPILILALILLIRPTTTVPIKRTRAPLRSPLNHTRPISKPRPKQHVRIREKALLERDDDELGAAEARAEEVAYVLSVREVECGVDLVEDVHGRRLELEEGHD